MQKNRNSSIELLRIIAMLMIVFHHLAVHGGFSYGINEITIPRYWVNLISIGGKIGVDIFVLISGYFLIEERSISDVIRKGLMFWGEVWFYSVAIYLLWLILGKEQFSYKEFGIAIMPILIPGWWFASCYLILFLLHPFINKFIEALEQKSYTKLLVLLVVIWSIIPTIAPSVVQSNSLLWFITLYLIAGYIKLYGIKFDYSALKWNLMAIGLIILTYLSSVIIMLISVKYEVLEKYIQYFYGEQKINVLIISICMLMAFLKIDIANNTLINWIGGSTFAVYLISDSERIRKYLFCDLFKILEYRDSILLIPYTIVVTVLIFIGCILIDIVRKLTIEKGYRKLVNFFVNKACKGNELISK